MPIYNLYIFNREGGLIYYREWRREKQSGISRTEEGKLFFGMLLSMRKFAERLSTRDGQQTINYFKTSTYKCSYLETATGLHFAINTNPDAFGGQELLQEIYKIYVETVIKNPLCEPSSPIESELFASKVDSLVTRHSAFV